MMEALLEKMGLKKSVGAPVHAGVNPVYFTDIYRRGEKWLFSWRSADHSKGGMVEGLMSKQDAEAVRNSWANERAIKEHAHFVHEYSL